MATLRAAPTKGTVTLNNSVEYLPTQYLPRPIPQGEGRDGKSQGTNWHTNSKLLQRHFAKNCKQATAYISHEVPLLEAMGHPRYSWGKQLTNIVSRLTLPKLYLATYIHCTSPLFIQQPGAHFKLTTAFKHF